MAEFRVSEAFRDALVSLDDVNVETEFRRRVNLMRTHQQRSTDPASHRGVVAHGPEEQSGGIRGIVERRPHFSFAVLRPTFQLLLGG